MVSKCWQDIKNDKEQTEKYEYLSLRDREAYSQLCKFCQENRNELVAGEIELLDAHVSLRSHDIQSVDHDFQQPVESK